MGVPSKPELTHVWECLGKRYRLIRIRQWKESNDKWIIERADKDNFGGDRWTEVDYRIDSDEDGVSVSSVRLLSLAIDQLKRSLEIKDDEIRRLTSRLVAAGALDEDRAHP